jgi:hypothetical protein
MNTPLYAQAALTGTLTEEELMPQQPKELRLQSKANNWQHLRERFEPQKYYEVRAKIMAECYLRGYNAKEIADYFKFTIQQVYKFCDIKGLKKIKYERAYKELILRDFNT